MTEAPERIWLPECHANDAANQPDGYGEFVSYTRTDIAHSREVTQIEWVKDLADTVIKHEARIAELEAALTECQEEIEAGPLKRSRVT
jgi:hypothetical protein